MEMVVAFAPDDSQDFNETAYLEVTGKEGRLPLMLRGTGIGPRLMFAYDVVDVGDVFITSVHRYELSLVNRGEIDATWQIGPNASPFGSTFVFEPSSGILAVGQSTAISVYMSGSAMGEFSEVFDLVMKGCTAVLHVHFKGTVVAPSFHMDVDTFGFGDVPFGFTQTQRFGLYNTSDVPFSYRLRVPRDQAKPSSQPEFAVAPALGVIGPGEVHQLQLDFTPGEVKDYEGYELVVDIEHVGTALLALPISARSVVPRVTLETPIVALGECFARHAYETALVFVNTEPAPARYTILPQDEQTAVVAAFTAETMSGIVPPKGRHSVPISLTCFQLGPIALPVFVAIAGNGPGQPLAAELRATGRGPLVSVTPSVLSFGTIPCLTPQTLKLTVHNKGLIPAPIALRCKSESGACWDRCEECSMRRHSLALVLCLL
jgi:hydrocephalus-inducing protein